MKTVKKNVYYCEHCNKHGLSAGHMRNHELHCTLNPTRKCRLCEKLGVSCLSVGQVATELRKRYKLIEPEDILEPMEIKWFGPEITMDEIRDLANDCPNCILAVLRQAGLSHGYFFSENRFPFHYETELKEFWDDYNKEQDTLTYGVDY